MKKLMLTCESCGNVQFDEDNSIQDVMGDGAPACQSCGSKSWIAIPIE